MKILLIVSMFLFVGCGQNKVKEETGSESETEIVEKEVEKREETKEPEKSEGGLINRVQEKITAEEPIDLDAPSEEFPGFTNKDVLMANAWYTVHGYFAQTPADLQIVSYILDISEIEAGTSVHGQFEHPEAPVFPEDVMVMIDHRDNTLTWLPLYFSYDQGENTITVYEMPMRWGGQSTEAINMAAQQVIEQPHRMELKEPENKEITAYILSKFGTKIHDGYNVQFHPGYKEYIKSIVEPVNYERYPYAVNLVDYNGAIGMYAFPFINYPGFEYGFKGIDQYYLIQTGPETGVLEKREGDEDYYHSYATEWYDVTIRHNDTFYIDVNTSLNPVQSVQNFAYNTMIDSGDKGLKIILTRNEDATDYDPFIIFYAPDAGDPNDYEHLNAFTRQRYFPKMDY